MSKCYASRLVAVAEAEIGYHEKITNAQLDDKGANAGSGNYTKYARDFDTKYSGFYNSKKNGFAWCDMFVDWCFVTAFGLADALRLLCQPTGSAGAGCTYSLQYYRNAGRYFTSPKIGDQIFFGTSVGNSTHTGIVVGVDAQHVYTIEGNTSDQVARRTYALHAGTIVGYGRPAFDVEGEAETPAPVVVVQPETPPEVETPPVNGKQTYNVGDVVTFKGTKHYYSAWAKTPSECRPGEAKVTAVCMNGNHKYHLIHTAGSTSNVFGWVNVSDIAGATEETPPAEITVGSVVRIKSGAKTYTGRGLASFVYNRDHVVSQINGDRAVVTYTGIVVAAVNVADLERV